MKEPIESSLDSTSSLLETVSLQPTASVTGITPLNTLRTSFPNQLNDQYQEIQNTSKPFSFDWKIFVAPTILLGQHFDGSRLRNWALNRQQYRHDILKDIQEHNIQILSQQSLVPKLERIVKLNNLVHHLLSISRSKVTVQSLPLHLHAQRLFTNTTDASKKTLGYIAFCNLFSRLSYIWSY